MHVDDRERLGIDAGGVPGLTAAFRYPHPHYLRKTRPGGRQGQDEAKKIAIPSLLRIDLPRCPEQAGDLAIRQDLVVAGNRRRLALLPAHMHATLDDFRQGMRDAAAMYRIAGIQYCLEIVDEPLPGRDREG